MIEKVGDLLRGYRDIPGKNIYFSAKQERIKDDNTGGMYYGPMMPGAKLGQAIPYLFDEVLCLRAEYVIKDDKKILVRSLQTQPDNIYTAKDRSGALAAYEKPDLSKIYAKISGGKKWPS